MASQPAAAQGEGTEITHSSLGETEIRRLFNEHASGLLEELSAEGYFDKPRLPADALDNRKLPDVVADRTGAAVFSKQKDGDTTRRIFISRELERGKLNIFFDRDDKAAYAVKSVRDETTVFGSPDQVTSDGCSDDCSGLCNRDPYILLREVREEVGAVDPECKVTEYDCNCYIDV